MRYQVFGRHTGLRVSEYALGTAGFGAGGASAGEPAAREIFAAYTGAGGTTFDTSSLYQDGQSETVLGQLLGDSRDDYVVITKYSGTRSARPRPGTTGNSRKTMIASLEASLRRLNTGYVDVLMPHFPDGVTPSEEILAALDDLVRAGKVRYGGLSNFPAWRVAGAAVRADLRGLAPLAGIETEYSLAERSAERELLPMAGAHGLGVLLYSPLAGGLLTGKYRRGEQGRLSDRDENVEGSAQRSAVVDTVLTVAAETGSSPAEVSLAWLRRRAALAPAALIPIVGPRSAAHLEPYLRSLDLELDEQHYQQLDEASAPRLGTPHEDVAAALSHGLDGDRTQLTAPPVPVT
jgi:aryl-alcohol dehydrogenase-like predicted oxidoreductase